MEWHALLLPPRLGIPAREREQGEALASPRSLSHELPADPARRVGIKHVEGRGGPLREGVAELVEACSGMDLEQSLEREGIKPGGAQGDRLPRVLKGRPDDRTPGGDEHLLGHWLLAPDPDVFEAHLAWNEFLPLAQALAVGADLLEEEICVVD